jgi:hypothetical protein
VLAHQSIGCNYYRVRIDGTLTILSIHTAVPKIRNVILVVNPTVMPTAAEGSKHGEKRIVAKKTGVHASHWNVISPTRYRL